MRRTTTALLLVLATLVAGCDGDETSSADPSFQPGPEAPAPPPDPDPEPQVPVAEVSCPHKGFSQLDFATGWAGALVDVCHDVNQNYVLIINTSAFYLSVAAATGSRVTEFGFPQMATLENLVAQEVVARWQTVPGTRLLPPGGWVVATGSPAVLQIGQQADVLAVTYAADKLVGYAKSRITSPDRALAKRIAGCAKEAGVTLGNVRDPNMNLDYLLTDTTLGAGLACGPLLRELTNNHPPPPATLRSEFARLGSSVKGSVWDDLARSARNFIQVLR